MFLKIFTTSLLSAGAGLVLYNQISNVSAESSSSEETYDTTRQSLPKIAIIGSGIGGSSAAYFIRQALGEDVNIDVYEKNKKVGGRLAVVDYEEHEVEAGGTIIHEANKYMVDFTNTLGLEKFQSAGDGKFGIYNGSTFSFMESDYGFITQLKMIWQYGLFSLWHLENSLSKMIKDFTTIYDLQSRGEAYTTVPDLLRAIGGDEFIRMVEKTAEEVMLEKGIGETFIHDFVTAITRVNYGQDAMVNGFTGYVSLAGAQAGELFSIKGGNWKVCEKLLENANAAVHFNQQIKRIRKENIDGKIVYYLENDERESSLSRPYDVVIVAAPLEVPTYFMTCEKCINWPQKENLGTYQKTIASFVRADLNFTYFNVDRSNSPSDVFTTENKALKYSSVGVQHNTSGDTVKNPPLYKVFSREKLTNDTLKEIFNVKDDTKVVSVSWLAYPHYTPPETFTPFVLDDGVFYVNAIERAASCMEMSAIGGKNAALLSYQYLQKIG